MAKVSLSAEAERDLIQIKDYISTELNNPSAANRTLSKITKRVGELSKFPELGTKLETIVPFQSEYRFLVCGNYLAFYSFHENVVQVDRIMYGRRDFVKELFGDLPKDSNRD